MDGKAYLWHEFEVSVWLITPCLQISLLSKLFVQCQDLFQIFGVVKLLILFSSYSCYLAFGLLM